MRNRRRCLDCAPYHYGRWRSPLKDDEKQCVRCLKHRPKTDFPIKNGKYTSYCLECLEKARTSKQRLKQECVDYKGGKCLRCGYNRCVAALEFHHRDRTKKDFAISHYWKFSLNDELKAELDKCDLLCSNCHKEIEYAMPLECVVNPISGSLEPEQPKNAGDRMCDQVMPSIPQPAN